MKKIKFRHNKKRNTAFLYEILVRELTKSVINKEEKLKKQIVKIIKEYFHRSTSLGKELELYRAIYETKNIGSDLAERLLQRVLKEREEKVDEKKLFNEQTELIKLIKKAFKEDVFANFLPNYKNLATITQLFNSDTLIKDKVLLEKKIIQNISENHKDEDLSLKPVDTLVYKTFITKFNEKYDENLLPEQKELIGRYILSFADNGIDFKAYMNEEIERLKVAVKRCSKAKEFSEDSEMKEKSKKVYEILENFKNEEVDESGMKKLLKIQQLINEIKKDEN
tara:strand:+ start:309 stop:1151 length:843 start_codon:yes stop_codon:yes gene_type:complete